MSGDRQAILVHVTGRVQGVGFRAWTRDQAARLGVAGWVRNEPDGSVSALVSGRQGAVEAMIERLRQGPSEARVSDLAIESADSGDLSEFRILR